MKLFVKLKMRIFKKFLAVLLVFASGVRCENYESLGRSNCKPLTILVKLLNQVS